LPTGYTEDELVEKPAIELFKSLNWQTYNAFHEFETARGSPLGRETKGEVVLVKHLRFALGKLNRELPAEAIELAIEELTRDRSTSSLVEANRQIYRLLKDGVKVTFQHPETKAETTEIVKVIDWENPTKNDFLLVSQLWVTGELYTKRADLVGFVNGLPLVFIELKASHKALEDAYKKNLSDYKTTIPHLFWYNAIIILSNGSISRVGSVSAMWQHFGEWKKINSEGEEGIISLATTIKGICEHNRLIDIIENFAIFQEVRGGLIKLLAKNHQFLGVNKAIEAQKQIGKRQGKLGVFWHTQGSGKSVSMIFFAQKILRKIPGNWSFVIVTDRVELDDQIYKEFTRAGVVTEENAQATSSEHLRQLLKEDHRYIFTLIHKFRTEKGIKHPVLSERSDIIVITDESHRSQYDTLAMNMRTALPKASFIAFTGTPLIIGEEKTRQVFGDYISIYNFKQSIDDDSTVPLYYENRIPELQLTNENLNEDIYEVIEESELDESQEKKLQREFSRQYHLITRDDRLETIAKDIANHFMGRGFKGKAMVVSIDKATAIKMYDKSRKYWNESISDLETKSLAAEETLKAQFAEEINFMKETDMAVVVSPAQNEIEEMAAKGVDIKPHRKRIVSEDLDTKFKDPDDRFRIVFVCAMWMTGFDVPCCSTIYIDKPLRNHSLMQTIARANRVFPEKENGLIVDYVGVFRNLEKALAIYGSDSGGGIKPGELPIQDKSELFELLKKCLATAIAFCLEKDIDIQAIKNTKGFDRINLLDNAVEAILSTDESKKKYLTLIEDVLKLYKAILPDPRANEQAQDVMVLLIIAKKIRSLFPQTDITSVTGAIEQILDDSIAAEGYVINSPKDESGVDYKIDLSKIDLETLAEKFKKGRKRTEAEKLRSAVEQRLRAMIAINKARIDYMEKFEKMIEEYNSGSINVEEFFNRLRRFAQDLTSEEKRHIAEQLSEEELALFDILTKPEMDLRESERKTVKKVAKELLDTLKKEKLVLDWRKFQASRASVRVTIEEILDKLPDAYGKAIYQSKCESVFQHIFESYYGPGQSIYRLTG